MGVTVKASMSSDAALAVAARQGSAEAFRQLVLAYQRPVLTLILRMVHDRELAEDLAQEAFVKAHRALATYDPALKFSSWMFKIAHNTTIDHLRRKPLETVSLDEPRSEGSDDRDAYERLADEASETPEAAVLRGDLGRALELALGGLRREYREVMTLRFQEGLAYEEVAEILGLPLGTVKTFIHRARKELAARLTAMGFAPASSVRETPRGAVEGSGGEG
jgi:RNA polymerase sigma-70 factor (ECF subfamily)